MRERSLSEYGRIGNEGKFDWNYYKANKKSKLIQIGTFAEVSSINLLGSEDAVGFFEKNGIKYLKVISIADDNGFIKVDCSAYGMDDIFIVNINALSEYVKDEETVKRYIAKNI